MRFESLKQNLWSLRVADTSLNHATEQPPTEWIFDGFYLKR